ncbi:hypothetical protein GCM10011512_19130 [Tersicoccus solisilvae]|uniref:DinB-like domain-containing protein n=1 Tax=Tersicoccus solisilvae TaxID=1882339 RepID=A0ABQ1P856_9MICC|nr:DinB family protein [Tersicoccus solisilvae]GGC92229.1 hypothetical protein GCM10011512_19130 [Tersicoccus solisilvae]
MDITRFATEQLTWHWNGQLRPRLDGLTDEEYSWEPVDGCWSLRQEGTTTAPIAAGSGTHRIEFAFPEPTPPPVTTIAWRLGHLLVGVYGARLASHFGGEPVDYRSYDYPVTAADALDRLDRMHAAWISSIGALTAEEQATPVGPAEGPFAESPMLALVLHINREVIHHGAEIALLRDLYAHRPLTG